jgi:spore maturation protein SpmB
LIVLQGQCFIDAIFAADFMLNQRVAMYKTFIRGSDDGTRILFHPSGLDVAAMISISLNCFQLWIHVVLRFMQQAVDKSSLPRPEIVVAGLKFMEDNIEDVELVQTLTIIRLQSTIIKTIQN